MTVRLNCLDDYTGVSCSPDVEYRLRPSDWKTFPRCSKHYHTYLIRQEDTDRRFPQLPPADYDWMDAGEYWGEDDY